MSISGLTIAGGVADAGGGIHSEADTLTLSDVRFVDNRAVEGGAVEQIGGALLVNGGTFLGNRAEGDAARGGAIAIVAEAEATISASRFARNEAQGGAQGAGGAIYAAAGVHLRVAGSTFVSNRASGLLAIGGAIDAAPPLSAPGPAPGTLALVGSRFTGNVASGQDGSGGLALGGAIASQGLAVSVSGATFVGNRAEGGDAIAADRRGDATGGAIYATSLGTGVGATIDSSDFARNAAVGGAGSGGGTGGAGNAGALALFLDGSISDSRFVSNRAAGGDAEGAAAAGFAAAGAISTAGVTTVTGTLLIANRAVGGASEGGAGGQANGGAISDSGTLTLRRTSVLLNEARGGAGAVGGEALGGGIATGNFFAPYFEAADSLIAGNATLGGNGSDTDGRGLGGGIVVFNGEIRLTRTRVVLNRASTDGDDIYPPSALP